MVTLFTRISQMPNNTSKAYMIVILVMKVKVANDISLILLYSLRLLQLKSILANAMLTVKPALNSHLKGVAR